MKYYKNRRGHSYIEDAENQVKENENTEAQTAELLRNKCFEQSLLMSEKKKSRLTGK